MCCMCLAGNAGPKKLPKICHLHHRTTLLGYIFTTKACIDNREKTLLNSNVSPTCPHNMLNFGPLAGEICWRVWGTPANFNGFRILAVLLHGTLVVGVSQTLRRWTEGATYIWQGSITLGIGPHSSYEGAVCMLLGDDAGQHDVLQTSVSANNNDGDVDNVVNNNDCVSPSSNSKLSPFLMHVCFS